MKIAASFIGILLVSGIALAAIHFVRQSQKAEATEQEDTTAVANPSVITHHSSLKPAVLTERDIPITRPENYRYTPEEIALLKKQADEAYVKWVQLELEIAKYNLEQMAQQ